MDPNRTLEKLRELTKCVNDEEQVEVEIESVETLTDFAELFEALDEWLTGGGFLPKEWRER